MVKPNWYELAEKEIGVKEKLGEQDHPRILEYLKETTLSKKYIKDSTAWCAAFVSAMLEWSKIPSTRSAWARSYLKWGIKLDKPMIGCIVVLWRSFKDSPNGHVGFYVGEDETHIKILGGNQSDQVKISRYPKERLLAYRWPKI